MDVGSFRDASRVVSESCGSFGFFFCFLILDLYRFSGFPRFCVSVVSPSSPSSIASKFVRFLWLYNLFSMASELLLFFLSTHSV